MKGSKKTPRNFTTPKAINISDIIRNGNKEGKTISSQISSPRTDASNDSSGMIIRAEAIKTAVLARLTDLKIDLFNIDPFPYLV